MIEVCGSSCEGIEVGGVVVCLCGRHWEDHDGCGEPRFKVPLHTVQGHPTTARKVARDIDNAVAGSRTRKVLGGQPPKDTASMTKKGMRWGYSYA